MFTLTWALPLAAVALLPALLTELALNYQRRVAHRPRRERVYLHQARVAAHRQPAPPTTWRRDIRTGHARR